MRCKGLSVSGSGGCFWKDSLTTRRWVRIWRGLRTPNTHVWSNQRPNPRALTGGHGSFHVRIPSWLPSLLQALLSLARVPPNNPERISSHHLSHVCSGNRAASSAHAPCGHSAFALWAQRCWRPLEGQMQGPKSVKEGQHDGELLGLLSETSV